MFDFVGRNKRVAQVILAMIALPFAFFGVDSYIQRMGRGEDAVATIGSDKISQAEFANALRDQQDRMRSMLGKNYDPAMFDNPEVRFSILEQLVNQRLLAQQSTKQNIVVSDDLVRQYIMDFPAFQENGKFSPDKARGLLASQGLTEATLEYQMRQQLQLQPLQDPFGQGAFVSRTATEQFMRLNGQQREVSAASIDIEPYLAQVKPDDAAIKAYYDGNQAAFQVPEQVRLETLTLTMDSIAAKIAVAPEDIKKNYTENFAAYSDPEQRQASHILISVKPDAKDAEKAAAKQKAEAILAQVKAAPDKFAEIAKKNSEDPGSKDQGGDLGYFPRGAMDKPFEDAVFGMKPNDIVGPVQSAFGFHIIRLTGVRPEKVKPFDEVKGQIEQEIKKQRASKQFAEAAENFQNLVYSNGDTLQPAADALQLKVAQSGTLLTRAQVLAMGMKNQKFVQAVFSPDSLSSKRNTDAIEVAQGVIMAARVAEYKPAAPRPFEEVKAEIASQLQKKGAGELAAKDGQAKLAELQAGKPVALAWDKPRELTRQQRQPGFTEDAMTKVFRVEASKLPAYAGAMNEKGGYSIYRITKVTNPEIKDDAVKAASSQLTSQLGRELFSSYLAALKQKSDVVIHQENFDKKDAKG